VVPQGRILHPAIWNPARTKYLLCAVPLYLFRNLAVWTLVWLLTINRSKRFANKLIVWAKAGEISECHRQSLTPQKKQNGDEVLGAAPGEGDVEPPNSPVGKSPAPKLR